MAEKTLQDIFGAGAIQDATNITIPKANLTTLAAGATHTGEEVLFALIEKAEPVLPESTYDTDPDQSIKIVRGDVGLETNFNNNVRYATLPFTITAKKVAPVITFTPADMK